MFANVNILMKFMNFEMNMSELKKVKVARNKLHLLLPYYKVKIEFSFDRINVDMINMIDFVTLDFAIAFADAINTFVII